MTRVCMLVLNSVSRDARVLKEAASLADAGYDLTIIGIQDAYNSQQREVLPNGVKIERVHYLQIRDRLKLVGKLLLIISVIMVLVLSILAGLPEYMAARLVDYVGSKTVNSIAGDLQLYIPLTGGLLGFLFFFRGFLRKSKRTKKTFGLSTNNASKNGMPDGSDKNFVRFLISPSIIKTFARIFLPAIVFASNIRKLNPDVLHCHDVQTLPAGLVAKIILRCKVVYDAHEIYEAVAQANPNTIWKYRLTHKLCLSAVDRFITINRSIADWYAQNYPRLSEANIIMNAAPKVDGLSYDGRLHKAAGLALQTKILLYQGGYAAKRGLEELVQSAAYLPPGWTLVMMGWGKLENDLRQLAQKTTSNIRFIPPAPVAELAWWTSGASVGVIPYEKVGLNHWFCTPNKLWEYPNAGVPVLVSPFPEMRRLVETYKYGWLLPEDWNAESLAKRIADLTEDDLEQARNGCSRIMTEKSWARFGDELVKMYAQTAPA